MSIRTYALPIEQTQWRLSGGGATTIFNWEYDEGRDKLLALYEKGKNNQWNATSRIDWSLQIDPEDPLKIQEEYLPICGSPQWSKLNAKERGQARHHYEAWRFSQFLHGEQGALICTAKIVQTVPDMDSKFYAATQVIDEARHVEVYARYLHEKLQLAYPISLPLRTLLEQAINDSRWDLTYLAMQVVIEGLALAAFNVIRDQAQEPLGRAINAYVMQDEARHVAFGRLALRDYYPHLSSQEIAEREDFIITACDLMRRRFWAEEVWERIGLDVNECFKYLGKSRLMRQFQQNLFSRIVPTLRDIGLWGPRVRESFLRMGAIRFEGTNLNELFANDEAVAVELDKLRAARDQSISTAIAQSQT